MHVVPTLCPRCARAVHKVCTIPYPKCIVVPSINNSEPREYRVRSPSPPPSPIQPGRSLLASPEAERHDPPPSRRSYTVYVCVTTISTGTADVTFVVGIGVKDIHAHGANRLHAQHQSRGPKERALRRLRHTPARTRRSATLSFDQFAYLWHWKVIRDMWMGSARDCGLG